MAMSVEASGNFFKSKAGPNSLKSSMKNSRREFLRQISSGACCFSALAAGCRSYSGARDFSAVETVLGPVAADRLGITLPHEHILVDFIGAEKISRERYDPEEVFRTALPHLQRIEELGCQSFVDCTPAYIGRDPQLLKRLAVASGLNVLTNTGNYGASKNKYLPESAFSESSDRLAERWIRESREGIEGTGIRPGFIKIGVDSGALSEMHRKLVRAAARCHWATGLTIAAHTGNGEAALDEINMIEQEGLKAGAFIWIHAQNESNSDVHARAAERGAWIEFDGIGPDNIESHVKFIRSLQERGFLHRVLLSHDAGWYHVGEPNGGQFRPFDTLFTTFLPALKGAGFTEEDVIRLTVVNPREAFKIQVRGR